MKKLLTILLAACLVLTAFCALADITAADNEETAVSAGTDEPQTERDRIGLLVAPGATAASAALPTPKPEKEIEATTGKQTFVSASRYKRVRKVSYYDNVYAVNHGEYLLQPFDSKVPEEYFIKDSSGTLALAPIVLDITDAMRERLYGADVGETAMFFGQYCEQIRDMRKKIVNPDTGKVTYTSSTYGYSGIHEGIDFVYVKGAELHAILGGVVTRAGDSNGTVGIYSEDLDITLLYLHCGDIQVKRGDVVSASDVIAYEGGKGLVEGIYNNASYKEQGLKHTNRSHYVHVELRVGRHTSSNPYRNAILESDCPYEYMRQALNIQESGRQPVTMAAVDEAQRMREEAEAKARAEAEALAAARAAAEATPEPVINIVEEETAPEGYGFAEETEAPAVEETPVPEATLPPAA